MTIIKFEEQIEHLIKSKERYLEEYRTKEGYEKEKWRTKEFVDSFNKESQKQKSLWYAEIKECEKDLDGHPFILTYLIKKITKGWFIFKTTEKIKLHICVYDTHMSFVENDYVVSDYGLEVNNKVFKYIPELKPILEKIPQAVFILPKEEINNLGKRMNEINSRIEEMEDKINS